MSTWSGAFGARTTADEVVAGLDLSGKVVVVTGANCGIGYHAARALASAGARTFFACRDVAAAEAARREATAAHPAAISAVAPLDLASVPSISDFASGIDADSIDVLICNAGVFGGPYEEVLGGIERTVGVCHFGHALLVRSLLPLLLAGDGARVVMVSSESHRSPRTLDFDKLPLSKDQYSAFVAYGQAKLCNVLFANELQRRHGAEGLTACSLHPGSMMPTRIARRSTIASLAMKAMSPFTKSLNQGAATTVVCATHPAPEEIAGLYFSDCRPKAASTEAQDPKVARRLWDRTEEWLANDLSG